MVSTKNLSLFVAAAAASSVGPRFVPYQDLRADLERINEATNNLTKADNDWCAGCANAKPVYIAEQSLEDAFQTAIEHAGRGVSYTAIETTSLMEYIVDVVEPDLSQTFNWLVYHKERYVGAGLKVYFQNAFARRRNSTNAFFDNLAQYASKETYVQRTLRSVQAKVVGDHQYGIDQYA